MAPPVGAAAGMGWTCRPVSKRDCGKPMGPGFVIGTEEGIAGDRAQPSLPSLSTLRIV
jgi:hypothetical protein